MTAVYPSLHHQHLASNYIDQPSTNYTAPAHKASLLRMSTVKSRAHSRLASLGRLRSSGSTPQQQQPQRKKSTLQIGQSPTQEPEASQQGNTGRKGSQTSTLSNKTSEASLSGDSKSDSKSVLDPSSRSSFLLASSNLQRDQAKSTEGEGGQGNTPRLIKVKPRTMHQTSSKLLRMTEDDRPFTRVRAKFLLLSLLP